MSEITAKTRTVPVGRKLSIDLKTIGRPSVQYNALSPKSTTLAEAVETTSFVDIKNAMNNVFVWEDPYTKIKKVTSVVTLPSGVDLESCTVEVTGGEMTGVSQELTIKFQWTDRYMSAKTIFWTMEGRHTGYEYLAEAQMYKKSLRKYQFKETHKPWCTISVQLPIPVMTQETTYESVARAFSPDWGTKTGPKQEVIITRMTAAIDTFQVKHQKVSAKHDSDYESSDDGKESGAAGTQQDY